jgi:Zn-dependent alcohol dehydrogenases
MDENYKISKYENKIKNTNDNDKIRKYKNKILKYKMNGGNKNFADTGGLSGIKTIIKDTSLIENGPHRDILRKPFPIKPDDYQVNLDMNNPIPVFAYGAINNKSKLLPVEFDRRAPRDDDVVFKILFCGVCHSDWHVIMDEWKNTKYPIVTGHEMTGIVIGLGKKVSNFNIGDKVALSPLYNSCGICDNCKNSHEQYCENDATETYNMPDRGPGDIKPVGPITQGGYSNIMVVNEKFLFKFPDNLPMDSGAPLLCAGITVYNAVKTLGIQPGQVLGVAGIGGLGSTLLKLCRILDIKTIALTTTEWKLKDSLRLGAQKAVLMKDRETLEKMEGTLDFIIDTIPFAHEIDDYLKLLKLFGTHCVVGAFFSQNVDFNTVIRKGKIIRASNIGSIRETTDFLNFCSRNNFYPEIELIQFDKLNETRDNLLKSKAKYRYVIDIENSMSRQNRIR